MSNKNKIQEINLRTIDNIKISANHYINGYDEVVIIAPGWCMTKDSQAFKDISNIFCEKYDVITLDFRGHGKSGGFYTFTSKEIYDLDIVVEFAQEKLYKNIYLVGFSLGAALCLIYGANKDSIKKIIAVSAPTDFNKIENKMWKKEAWKETFEKFEIKRFCSIRPYPIPLKKIKPIDIISNIKVPTLFIAGQKDPTVCCWHTKNLYQQANCIKEYKEYKNGYHAEDLYIHFQEDFSSRCIDWLSNNK